MNQSKAAAIAAGYFKNHTVNELFITHDEQAFFNKQSADNHASSFPKEHRGVFEVSREDAEAAKGVKSDEEKIAEAAAKLEKNKGKVQAKIDKLNLMIEGAKQKFEEETDEKKKLKVGTIIGSYEKDLVSLQEELASITE